MTSGTRTRLGNLYNAMQHCKECERIQSNVTGLAANAPGDPSLGHGKLKGYGKGRLMFVAQNPSCKRIPYVVTPCDAGISRDLLWLLNKVGIADTDVFFTNLVKCSTPRNRLPSSKEINKCTEKWLRDEIEITSPLLIVPVGRSALAYFGGSSFEQPFVYYDGDRRVDAFGIWHPSHVVRAGKYDKYLGQLRQLKSLWDRR